MSLMASRGRVLFGSANLGGNTRDTQHPRVGQNRKFEESGCFAKLGGRFTVSLRCGSKFIAKSEDLSSAIAIDDRTVPHKLEQLPSIGFMYLCSSWSEDIRRSLQAAISQVFDQNPILTGKLVQKDGCYYVLPGFFPLEELFIVKEGPSVLVPSSTQERVTFMHDVLGPHFKKHSWGLEQLAHVLPLFQLEVLTLPAGMACICMAMSHMVGDANAYSKIVQLINDALQGKEITPMVWKSEGGCKDKLTAGVFALTLKVAVKQAMRKLMGDYCNPCGVFIVDAEKCADLKKSLRRDVAFLSTNDVTVAAMAEVLPGKMTMMMKNERGRVPGKDVNLGGNHVSMACGCVAGDPVAVRKLVSMDTTTTNEVSPLDLLTGDVHIATNLSGIGNLEGAGLVTLVRCLLPLRRSSWYPVMVITKADQETTVVNHNMDAKELQLLARGKLLSRLMKA